MAARVVSQYLLQAALGSEQIFPQQQKSARYVFYTVKTVTSPQTDSIIQSISN